MADVYTYNFPDHRRGTTFDGVEFAVTVNGAALDLTSAVIEMAFRRDPDYPDLPPQLLLSTTGSSLAVTDAAAGEFQVYPFLVGLEPGKYYYDAKFTLPGPLIKVYIEGTWTITRNIT